MLQSHGHYQLTNKSYLFLFPIERASVDTRTAINPWDSLRKQLIFDENLSHIDHPLWVGYLSYEMGAFADRDKELPYQKPNIPLACFYKYAVSISYDHKNNYATILTHREKAPDIFLSPDIFIDFIKALSPKKHIPLQHIVEQRLCSKKEYCDKIAQAKKHIISGDIFQVNLSRECLFSGNIDPFSLYQTMCYSNPSAFSAYLNFSDFCIVSASPERFLCLHNNLLETRPIKGTLKRGDLSCDAQKMHQLLTSEKERSELFMIIDLMRNDLGKISELGSVQVRAKQAVEFLPHILHQYAIITSIPRNFDHPLDIIRSLFPAGSITGCPKLRSMEIIHAIEQRARGIYTGNIGYFTTKKHFDFNVAIRTAVVQDATISLQLGGAITYDSIAEKEFEETIAKGQAFLHALRLP